MNEASPGTVIGIAGGDYYIFAESDSNPRPTLHNKHNVTVRSVAGRFEDVTLWGSGFHKLNASGVSGPGAYLHSVHNEMLIISGGSTDITIYGITIRESTANGYKIEGTNERNITLDTVRAIDINEYMVKGSGPSNDLFVYNLVIVNSHFENTRRANNIPGSDHIMQYGSYIGGINIMNTRGSYIAGNTFVNILGNTGDPNNFICFGAIGFWGMGGHEDAIVENNFIYNCGVGIMLGLTGELTSGRPAVNRGIVRNNIIFAANWNSITMGITDHVQIYNNTIINLPTASGASMSRGIRDAYENSTNLTIKNNIAHGMELGATADRACATIENNLITNSVSFFANLPPRSMTWLALADYYYSNGVSPADFALMAGAARAIEQAEPLPFLVDGDFFGNPRGSAPDMGAVQFNIIPPGGRLGDVLHSDITAYINGRAIPAHNVHDRTFVTVEHLENYGFDVLWNKDQRTLRVELNSSKDFSPLPFASVPGAAAPSESFKSNYYHTDVRTFLSGSLVRGLNIAGETLIDFEELSRYGEIKWDRTDRSLRLTLDNN
jgi:hypothetical protein